MSYSRVHRIVSSDYLKIIFETRMFVPSFECFTAPIEGCTKIPSGYGLGIYLDVTKPGGGTQSCL